MKNLKINVGQGIFEEVYASWSCDFLDVRTSLKTASLVLNNKAKEYSEEYFLEPAFSSCKSFYKKARIEEYNIYDLENSKSYKLMKLYSYTQLVAFIIIEDDGKGHVQSEGHVLSWFSSTTTRHIKEFFKQYGEFTEGQKEELFKKKLNNIKNKNYY